MMHLSRIKLTTLTILDKIANYFLKTGYIWNSLLLKNLINFIPIN